MTSPLALYASMAMSLYAYPPADFRGNRAPKIGLSKAAKAKKRAQRKARKGKKK